MAEDQEILEAVDSVVDEVENWAGRLGISEQEMAERVINELQTREWDE
jgi:hypothetical protein